MWASFAGPAPGSSALSRFRRRDLYDDLDRARAVDAGERPRHECRVGGVVEHLFAAGRFGRGPEKRSPAADRTAPAATAPRPAASRDRRTVHQHRRDRRRAGRRRERDLDRRATQRRGEQEVGKSQGGPSLRPAGVAGHPGHKTRAVDFGSAVRLLFQPDRRAQRPSGVRSASKWHVGAVGSRPGGP